MLKLTRVVGCAVALLSTGVFNVACSRGGDSDSGGPAGPTVKDDGKASVTSERAALTDLSQAGIRVTGGGVEPTKLSGRVLGHGVSAPAAAEAFVEAKGAALRLDKKDRSSRLSPEMRVPSQVPVMFDKSTGRYKFTRISYGQARDGIPVYGARVDVLVRNEPGSPVVMATSTARSLGNYQPTLRGARVDAQKARAAIAQGQAPRDLQGRARQAVSAKLDTFGTPETVIWAGTRQAPVAPTVALTYVAESKSGEEKWRIVADAETGDVLHRENLIVFETVEGSVAGEATPGARAADCDPTVPTPLPFAPVTSGETISLADENGAFSFDAVAGTAIDVTSTIAGEYFVVNDYQPSRNISLSQSVSPPATIDFLHEAADEFALAQVNGYVHAHQVRGWVLDIHPDYPTVSTQTAFPVNVNRSDVYCPGNAWYDYSSINFCVGSASYGNTSFASVNHHEYGHHLVASGGSGQGAYGEGMSDVIAMLIADDPGLGYGFYKDQCSSPLRSADNDCQYTASSCSSCGSESHACGKLLSGVVWDIRQALGVSQPEEALGIVSALALNSILLHTGTAVGPQIAVDFLTLDDDDGNVGNGTPHRAAICSGFEAHGIECPELETGLQVSPETAPEATGDVGGPFEPGAFTYTLENLGPDPLEFTATVDVPWLSVDVSSGSLAVGATQDVVVSINEAANALELGKYLGSIRFEDSAHPEAATVLPVALQAGQPSAQYTWNLDADPGFSREGLWEYGVPLGGGGSSPDPTSGFTGDNVLGYNLAGSYESSLPERHLTTPPIDCSELSGVSLRFRRWLNVESNRWDHAYVRVSTDGTNWTTVWENGGNSLFENAWTAQELDISQLADGKPTVYVRWTMGTTDSIVQYGGWNLDDIEIWAYGEVDSDCEFDADCDDGAFCNGSEVCVDGTCAAGTPALCDDGVECTTDVCNEATDSCESGVDHSVCDDGLFCNGSETCTLDGCQTGTPVTCDDGIGCSADSCDETVDACAFDYQDALCDNGSFCDGAEVCDAALGCVDSADPCEGGTCDEGTNMCSFPPSCDDGQQNGTETDVDCGGTCDGCTLGKSCGIDADCAEGTCQDGVCMAPAGGVTASVRVDTDWGSGYCATILIDNGADSATTGWTVEVDLQGTITSSRWSGVFTTTATGFTASNFSWNGSIGAGSEVGTVGFCATRPGGGSAVATVSGASGTF